MQNILYFLLSKTKILLIKTTINSPKINGSIYAKFQATNPEKVTAIVPIIDKFLFFYVKIKNNS